MTGPARLLGVFTGRPEARTWLGREVTSSTFKRRAPGAVQVLADRLEGDEQADPANHGGPDKAVCAYADEDARWWADQLGRALEDAQFGENLTTAGLELHDAVIGETWRVGSAVLQVSEPRTPCWKLGLRMGDPAFPRRFAASRRTGIKLRVLQQGSLAAGDAVEVLHRPAHGVTVRDINEIYYGRGRDLEPMRRAVELAPHWRGWAAHRKGWHLQDDAG